MGNRITNADRASVEEVLLNRAFKDREQLLKNDEDKLARDVVNALVPAQDRPVLEKYVGRFVAGTCCVCVRGSRRDGDYRFVRLDTHDTVIDADCSFSELSPELAERVIAHDQRAVELNNDRIELKRKIRAVLYSTNSWKKLYEIWPDLKTVVPQIEEATSCTALTTDIPALNKALNLP